MRSILIELAAFAPGLIVAVATYQDGPDDTSTAVVLFSK